MKKIAWFCLLLVSLFSNISPAANNKHNIISAAYSRGDIRPIINDSNGANLKYSHEDFLNDKLGWIASLNYSEKEKQEDDATQKHVLYFSLTGGRLYRINDWSNVYTMVGMGFGRFTVTPYAVNGRAKETVIKNVGLSLVTGVQLKLLENLMLDLSYERCRISNIQSGIFMIGLGFHF